MRSFAHRLEQYVAVRRRLGYDLTSSARELRPFAAFADAEGVAGSPSICSCAGKNALGQQAR